MNYEDFPDLLTANRTRVVSLMGKSFQRAIEKSLRYWYTEGPTVVELANLNPELTKVQNGLNEVRRFFKNKRAFKSSATQVTRVAGKKWRLYFTYERFGTFGPKHGCLVFGIRIDNMRWVVTR